MADLVDCGFCGLSIFWRENLTGGWWLHQTHPADDHDGFPKNPHVFVPIWFQDEKGHNFEVLCFECRTHTCSLIPVWGAEDGN